MSTDTIDDGRPAGFLGRLRGLILDPQGEWRRIADEVPSHGGYVLPLAFAGAAAGLLNKLMQVAFAPGQAWIWLSAAALIHVAFAALGVAFVAWISDRLAPRFGGERDSHRAQLLAAHSATVALLAGVAVIVPLVAPLLLLAGAIYAIVLFGLGARVMLNVPEARAVMFTLSVLAIAFAAAIVVVVALTPWINRGRDAVIAMTPGFARQEEPPPRVELSESARVLTKLAQSHGQRVPTTAARLQEQLPLTLPGGFALAGAVNEDLHGLVRTRGEYHSGSARLYVSIIHLVRVSDVAATSEALDVPETDNGYTRRQSIDGRAFVEQIDGEAVRYIVIGRGVAMRVDGEGGVTVDQARAAVETIDLQRLEQMFG
ncbi:MAG: Yip1 family protein [Hyphomonadaceae bacterium]